MQAVHAARDTDQRAQFETGILKSYRQSPRHVAKYTEESSGRLSCYTNLQIMPETTFWICDKCGEPITSPDQGWIQWLNIRDEFEDSFRSDSLQLVHHFRKEKPKCMYDGNDVMRERNATTADGSLSDFVGDDGLMRLLSFVNHREFVNNEQVIEMIKRIFVPGYERVRHYLDEAKREGVFEPNTPEGYPHMSDIKAVWDWLDESER